MVATCPPAVAAALGDSPWRWRPQPADRYEGSLDGPLDPAGESAWPGSVWEVGTRWALAAQPGSGAARAEAERLEWLGARVGCPEVVMLDGNWLVITAPIGAGGDHPERQPRPDDLPAAIGSALRQVHQLPAEACPFDRGWSVLVAEIEAGVAAGWLHPDRLPPPYDRYQPDQLVELVRTTRPVTEDVVVGHGRPVVANLFFDRGTLSGVTGLWRLGRADRHLDLAIVYRSLQLNYGPEAVFGFIEGYGLDPDLTRLDYYIMIDVLVSALDAHGIEP